MFGASAVRKGSAVRIAAIAGRSEGGAHSSMVGEDV
jgi:hypothetical protein